MLKFFRKYNKIILIFGASLLMVAFLIQPVMSMFRFDPTSEVLGTMTAGGQQVTRGDQITAAGELRVLKNLPPLGRSVGDDALRWLLLVRDARRMGLSASDYEVDQALQLIAGSQKEQVLDRLVMNLKVKKAFIRQAVRHWIMAEQYGNLMGATAYRSAPISLGRGPALTLATPALQQLGVLAQVMQLQAQARAADKPQQAYQAMMQAQRLQSMTLGTQRMSSPLIQHVIQDQRATIAGQVLVMTPEAAKAKGEGADPPSDTSEARLQALFEKYRDTPPGQGRPYGIGYRIPDRVKIQYLAIPITAVTDTIQVDEREAVAYYDQHPAQFQLPADRQGGQSTRQAYRDARDRIIQKLTQQRAQDKVRRMVRAATAALVAPERRLATGPQGYKQVPQDFKPTSMGQVAADLAQRFGVTPRLYDDTDEWIALDRAKSLPGIGDSGLADRSRIRFPQYLATARGLEPAPDNPLTSLRLQSHLVSAPLQSDNGSMYLFRLQGAQPAHAPQSLDEVRSQVARDARRIAAYQKLVHAKDQWLAKAKAMGLAKLADQTPGAVVNQVPPTPRRSFGAGSSRSLPTVPGVGRSQAFMDQAFAQAQRLSEHGKKQALEKLPAARRLIAVAVDERLSLAIFRLDRYQPLTRAQYRDLTALPQVESFVDHSIQPPHPINPLSRQALEKRLGYHEAGG